MDGIFKLSRPEEVKSFGSCIQEKKATEQLNRSLLWHGSKAANLMSIFMNGLLVDAPFAPVTGKVFGNGLYTASVFEKSFKYTYDWRSSKWAGSKYMFLCDVAMGRTQKIVDQGYRDS